jgi:hypothetical protein
METNTDSMFTVTDETIINYYKENPHLDFVTINRMFISILKNLSSNLTDSTNSKIISVENVVVP